MGAAITSSCHPIKQQLHFDCPETSVCPKDKTVKSPDRTETQVCATDATVRPGVEGGKVCRGYHQPEVDPQLVTEVPCCCLKRGGTGTLTSQNKRTQGHAHDSALNGCCHREASSSIMLSDGMSIPSAEHLSCPVKAPWLPISTE